MPQPQAPNEITLSVRLGWLSVEAFGRLQRAQRSGRRIATAVPGGAYRFSFSHRDLSPHDHLISVLQQLKRISADLAPDLPALVPADPDSMPEWVNQDVQALWSAFENWSREVWVCLQMQDPLVGQAFTYGGSLADTFWYADVAGPGELKDLLRPQRLEAVAERFDSIRRYLPDHAARVIHHTLYRWRDAGRLRNLDEQGQKRLLARLEAQAKVWSDLLFGLQRAEDYLRRADRRLIAWGAFTATTLLTLLVGLAVWSGVLLLSGTGRTLLALTSGVPGDRSGAGGELAQSLFDWQNWSALLAALSSVVVVLTGFVTHLSGWMIAFYRMVKNWLELRLIYQRTLRF